MKEACEVQRLINLGLRLCICADHIERRVMGCVAGSGDISRVWGLSLSGNLKVHRPLSLLVRGGSEDKDSIVYLSAWVFSAGLQTIDITTHPQPRSFRQDAQDGGGELVFRIMLFLRGK